jgi:hypothetical protein
MYRGPDNLWRDVMANFLVSFRLEENSTYQVRYDSLMEEINKLRTSTTVWDETTSLCIFEANGTAASVCEHLYLTSKVMCPPDILVVVDVGQRTVAQKGCKYPSLLKGYLGF